jgi:hypothetical protein
MKLSSRTPVPSAGLKTLPAIFHYMPWRKHRLFGASSTRSATNVPHHQRVCPTGKLLGPGVFVFAARVR